MEIKKNVEAPPAAEKYTKYPGLREAIIEMPIDSWIEVCFDEPATTKHRNLMYAMPGNRSNFRLRTTITGERTMKIGKFPIEKE